MLLRIIIAVCALLVGGCAAEIDKAMEMDHLIQDEIASSGDSEPITLASEESRKKRAMYAREVTFQVKAGTAPVIPALYEGKHAYSPQFTGDCRVTVIEYDTMREVTDTFAVDVCPDEQ